MVSEARGGGDDELQSQQGKFWSNFIDFGNSTDFGNFIN